VRYLIPGFNLPLCKLCRSERGGAGARCGYGQCRGCCREQHDAQELLRDKGFSVCLNPRSHMDGDVGERGAGTCLREVEVRVERMVACHGVADTGSFLGSGDGYSCRRQHAHLIISARAMPAADAPCGACV
jgi:hypothetical protein